MTLDSVVIGLGETEFCPALTYVAISRIKDPNNMIIISDGETNPFCESRIMDIRNSDVHFYNALDHYEEAFN